MRNLSRVFVIAVLLASLVACGDSEDKSDSAEARTEACRSYELLAGADGKRIAELLDRVLDGTGSYNSEQVLGRLVAVRAAAAKAGLTEDLPAKDYRAFRDLVDASLALEPSISGDDDNAGIDRATVTPYATAVRSLTDGCA